MRTLLVTAIVLVLIVFGFFIFRGRGPRNTPVTPRALPSLASTEAEVRYTIDGQPINSEEEHYSVQITVSRDQKNVTVFRGYLGTSVKTKTFSNNERAYEVFLSALESQRFSSIKRSANNNELGSCPLGLRYFYEILNNENDNLRTWSTSCGGQGTYGGASPPTVRQIFQNQIPDYNDFIRGVPGVQV